MDKNDTNEPLCWSLKKNGELRVLIAELFDYKLPFYAFHFIHYEKTR